MLPVSATPKPTIGIVTVLYNSNEVLEDFFLSLGRQRCDTFALKLYVIDNSSNDSGSIICRAKAAALGIPAEVVFNNANLGVAKGNNQGIELALADGCSHVLLSNNDLEFAGGVIEGLLRRLQAGDASAVTPKIHYFEPDQCIWFVEGTFNLWTMQVHHLGIGQKDAGQFDGIRRIDYAPTCFMLFKAEVFEQLGRMDEQYFVYYDDTDFLWRMKRAGKHVEVEPGCLVRHKVSSSTGGDLSPFSLYYSNRNRIYFLRKHLRGLQKVVALCYVLCTRLLQYVLLPGPSAARLKQGVRDGLRMTPSRSDQVTGRSAPTGR